MDMKSLYLFIYLFIFTLKELGWISLIFIGFFFPQVG